MAYLHKPKYAFSLPAVLRVTLQLYKSRLAEREIPAPIQIDLSLSFNQDMGYLHQKDYEQVLVGT